jgi:BMFP domain-containing protein YqiC
VEGTPEQKRLAVLERRRLVAERYLRGQLQHQIAQAFEVTQQQISLDLAAIRREWRKQFAGAYDAIKNRELAKLDMMEREYLDAWERSKKEHQTTRTKRRTGKQACEEAELKKEHRDGDPRYMDGALRCVELRLRVIGALDKAGETVLPAGTINVRNNFNLTLLSLQQLEELEKIRVALAGGDSPRALSPPA